MDLLLLLSLLFDVAQNTRGLIYPKNKVCLVTAQAAACHATLFQAHRNSTQFISTALNYSALNGDIQVALNTC